jgi:DNA modification methylase
MSVSVITGDCLDVLRGMPDQSVHCCVTSPPYWGLRDYGVDSQVGLENTPEAFVARLVGIFSEVKRVLRDDGTIWVNLGDSYNGLGPSGGPGKQYTNVGSQGTTTKSVAGLKVKDLCGIPWRVAFALQADGWYLRSDIIWSKPNPMPESVTDRPTKAHEYIFLLAKSEKYWYDADAIAEPMVTGDTRRPYGSPGANALDPRGQQGNGRQRGYDKPYKGAATKDYVSSKAQDPSATKARIVEGILSGDITSRNKRSVWTVTTKPYSGAHFATFPPDLIEPCIKAGCPVGGTVLDPFGGAGTAGLVADRLQRNAILIELNPEYAQMARKRIQGDAPLFAEVA